MVHGRQLLEEFVQNNAAVRSARRRALPAAHTGNCDFLLIARIHLDAQVAELLSQVGVALINFVPNVLLRRVELSSDKKFKMLSQLAFC